MLLPDASMCTTGVQGPCDLAQVFKLKKQALKTMTLEHVPDSEATRKQYTNILKQEESNGLKLDWRTLSCVTYMLTIYPSIVAKVDTPKNVAQGFVEAGFITSLNEPCPDADAMLRTCKEPWQREEKDEIVRGNFDRFMTETLALGQLRDDTMLEHGVDADILYKADAAEQRPSLKDDDARVWKMRAMLLTSEHQLALKVQRETERLDREQVQMKRAERDVDNWLQLNSQCENVIMELLQQASDDRTGDMSPRFFGVCSPPITLFSPLSICPPLVVTFIYELFGLLSCTGIRCNVSTKQP